MNNKLQTINDTQFIKSREEELAFAAIFIQKFTKLKEMNDNKTGSDFKYYAHLLDCYLEIEPARTNSLLLKEYPLDELNKIESDLANVILKIMIKNNIIKKVSDEPR